MLTRNDLDAGQINAIQFIDTGEDTLLAADVGTGKTAIALTAAQDAMDTGDVSRWLVLAPLLVATDTWANEPAEWEHLKNCGLAVAHGSPEQRHRVVDSDAPIVVTNYENLEWLMREYPKKRGVDQLPFDGLIADEVDKLKSVFSERFKASRNRLGVFNKRIGMTGTLIPNNLTELWAQLFIIDGGATFSDIRMRSGKKIGRSFYSWREHFFYPTDYKQRNWAPFPDTEEFLIESLKGLAFRLPAQGLPDVVMVEPDRLVLPTSVQPLYDELKKEFYAIVEDNYGKDREIEAANRGVLTSKLQQICAGFNYVDGGSNAVWHSKKRFGWLEDKRKSLAEQQLLVFYHFKEEVAEFYRRYPRAPIIGGGVSQAKKMAAIRHWNNGNTPIMAMHAQSAAHGLNLQKSGAQHVAFLTLPWSGSLFNQGMGRLARRGATVDQVFAHTALYQRTIDQDVFAVLIHRREQMENFLTAMFDNQRGHRGAA